MVKERKNQGKVIYEPRKDKKQQKIKNYLNFTD
jgi:hypothetical protein